MSSLEIISRADRKLFQGIENHYEVGNVQIFDEICCLKVLNVGLDGCIKVVHLTKSANPAL